METIEISNFNKNYIDKIKQKLNDNTNPEDINNIIIFLNYCFLKKNNFFVNDFNKRVIKDICQMYNQLKTNILTPTINDIFKSIKLTDLHLLRFIITNSINNYEEIQNNNIELCSIISKDSLKNGLIKINKLIKEIK